MQHYVNQLFDDLAAITLHRWRECPPHYCEMGITERWLDPPPGYNGPAFGFGQEEDEDLKSDYLSRLKFEAAIEEVEVYKENRPKVTMFDHFGFDPALFPPSDRLSDEQLDMLTAGICRLLAAHKLSAVFPIKTPGRVVYPFLVEGMQFPSMLARHGNIGIELCEYKPAECPFGAKWCDCKDMY
jgi:hypothetical protein